MALEQAVHLLYPRTYTHQERGLAILDIVSRRVLTDRPDKLGVLEVGIGKTSDIISCPYEPYWLAALLESRGVNYSMVLVDKDQRILDDVAGRRRVYAAFSIYAGETLQMQSWRKYLALTGQDRTMVHAKENGLEFTGFGWAYLRKRYLPWEQLKQGVLAAAIPAGFAERLADGRVSLAKGNIVAMDLKHLGEFDLIVSMNTLCYLSRTQQAWTIYKMANALRRGGKLLVGDVEKGWWGLQPLADEFGGWLNQQKAAELGLTLEETSSEYAINPFVLFKKN